MRTSLVVATIGRTEGPARLLASLAAQTRRDLEVVVVDQNDDDRLAPVLDAAREGQRPLDVRRVRLPAAGVSRARNAGLALARGDLVAFPDDDCWYAPDLLERVVRFLEAHPGAAGISGLPVDEGGRVLFGRRIRGRRALGPCDVWFAGGTITHFLRRSVLDALAKGGGPFDETLGPGAGTPFGAGEDTDLVLRALLQGFRLEFDASLGVHHPETIRAFDAACAKRQLAYARGWGRVLRKHRRAFAGLYGLFGLYMCARPLGGLLVALATGRFARALWYHRPLLVGRLGGFLAR